MKMNLTMDIKNKTKQKQTKKRNNSKTKTKTNKQTNSNNNQRRADRALDNDSDSDYEIRTRNMTMNWPRFLLVESGDDSLPFTKRSPFAIDKGFQTLISGRLRSIKRLRNGAFLVECDTKNSVIFSSNPKI